MDSDQLENIRKNLVAYLIKQKWAAFGIQDLNNGFALLTDNDKQIIVDSLKNDDDCAKTLIRNHLLNPIQVLSAQEADLYISNNSIPIDVIGLALQ